MFWMTTSCLPVDIKMVSQQQMVNLPLANRTTCHEWYPGRQDMVNLSASDDERKNLRNSTLSLPTTTCLQSLPCLTTKTCLSLPTTMHNYGDESQ